MHYLTVDGMLSGTGIRDSVSGGYIKPSKLGISTGLSDQIAHWLNRYEQAHYAQFNDKEENEHLDQEGIAICKKLQCELPQSKIEYFSNAEMQKIAFA
jgi:hypothetical protein